MKTTLEKLQNHLVGTIKVVDGYKPVVPSVRCADGSTMSVQASERHYSLPRENYGPYTHVEVCCSVVDAWVEYGRGEEPYAYVPIELVVAEIDRRGGFAK